MAAREDLPIIMSYDHLSLLTDTPPSSTDSASSQADSPPDWSQFSSLWDSDSSNLKFDPPTLDFGLNVDLNMDLDFGPSLAVDPSALHFDPKIFSITDLSPFPQQHQVVFPQSLAPRRLSITSSSSSGASFSPIQDPAGTNSIPSIPSTATPSPNLLPGTQVSALATVNDPVDELAQSVRLAAGVTLAVPVQGQAQQLTFSSMHLTTLIFPLPSNHDLDPPKLPIPRLQRPSPTMTAGTKRKSPVVEPTSPLDPALGGAVAVIGRPKTSHTTIERRYRTNLNARIQSLKDAVPALRVLENKERVKKAPDSAEGAESDEKIEKPVWDDVVDERGFVDGIKVARKISKANVLGKAAEYIL
jgi:hypothetical protein